jgi:hypothetical protein
MGFVEGDSNAGGALTVTDGAHVANLTPLGQYAAAQFTSASDGHGGALIGAPPLTATIDPGVAVAASHRA